MRPASRTFSAEIAVGEFIYGRISELMNAKAGTPAGRELAYLTELVEDVEEYGVSGDDLTFLENHWRR